ncbi:MAG: beta-N-acetylhexosaminidase [Alphaproteobacteria bacterium]|nr:beta-N-acetylhexosaminidase [Alphaproteobacteria bacterium]MBU1513958.1 beta-N-acetylhexosaminidase [Alphaproteobacteria bacterium]MBU2093102.1 beta-N-acetylhexosaminidase [Alphaproteobacteria bacterium]MBU2309485.1 beta-N-acetylhexosaminidase [Alphaproteobacteria bacterium]MBU2361666.1 beta-N-acetylhexosaminidase [Alphaproteobacteria bacterium]
MSVSACILGCAGPTLTKAEKAFFADVRPWGFILFARNVETPDQVRALTSALRETVGRPDAPILIDQEGGRVQRLGPPHWRRYPPGRAYGQAADARELTRLGARLMAHDLSALGINVDCLPVLDVPDPQGHAIIGDRAYSDTADQVAVLGRAACEGLIAGGVLPVVKHIPGHGRAKADSHLELPVVDAAWDDLEARDFAPFKALSDMPMAMTAHVIFSAVDAKRPATTSRKVLRKVVRGTIGFDGLLMSDDLSMKALRGDVRDRAEDALRADCDVVLHCNGDMAEMKAVAAGTGALKGHARRRAHAALARLPTRVEPFDAAEARARFDAAFEGRFAA